MALPMRTDALPKCSYPLPACLLAQQELALLDHEEDAPFDWLANVNEAPDCKHLRAVTLALEAPEGCGKCVEGATGGLPRKPLELRWYHSGMCLRSRGSTQSNEFRPPELSDSHHDIEILLCMHSGTAFCPSLKAILPIVGILSHRQEIANL
eukprot:1160479-Pelagomonas_calceolata.AAC.11